LDDRKRGEGHAPNVLEKLQDRHRCLLLMLQHDFEVLVDRHRFVEAHLKSLLPKDRQELIGGRR
jgi:hypothetical protein